MLRTIVHERVDLSSRTKRTFVLRVFCVLVLGVAVLAGCDDDVDHGTPLDARVVVAPRTAWPAAQLAQPDAPPHIVAVQMNATRLVPGNDWFGRIVTSTNVASVEIRTESFSFNATRVAFGQFVFRQHILDIVPPYKRDYTLYVIARNAAGQQDGRAIPIALR
jgi:hypothetical protein